MKCSSVCPNALFGAARFTVQCVRSVGEDVSLGKQHFQAVRKSVKLWDVSGDGQPWKVELGVLDLGGGLGPFLKGPRRLPMGLLRLVLCRWESRSSWVWLEVNIYRQGCMLLELPLPAQDASEAYPALSELYSSCLATQN